MVKRFCWAILLLLVSWTVGAQDTIQVILLAGQSNMEGCGLYDKLSTSDKERIEAVAPRVLLSNKGSEPAPLSFEYSKYKEEKYGSGNVFGPEMFIGLTFAETYSNQQFLLIKLAQGGTSLYGAWNPEWDPVKADYAETTEFKKKLKLYEMHLKYVADNLKRLQEEGRVFKIVGMVWMQGENDAAKELCAKSYEKNLKKLIVGYRKALNQPTMPFVMGQINSTYGDFPTGPEMVREAMKKVADADPFCEIVLTRTDRQWLDFPKHSDNVHYNTEGQMRLGRAMAHKLMKLQVP